MLPVGITIVNITSSSSNADNLSVLKYFSHSVIGHVGNVDLTTGNKDTVWRVELNWLLHFFVEIVVSTRRGFSLPITGSSCKVLSLEPIIIGRQT